ncbi:MAG: DUF3808 domain-containing protein, partial [Candidatus Omnitrophica bacterium]|nr:DUF3808 domain-containing protein [Candidatus Omnitrophota bacterium]
QVPTNSAFVSYLRRFDDIIGSIDNKCINSTEGGANIKGTEVMPLKESIEKYCHQEVPIQPIIQECCITDPINYQGIIEDIEHKINEISRILTLVTKGLKTNKEIAARIKKNKVDDPKTDDIIIKNYKISTEIQKFCEAFQLTASFLRKEIFEINRSGYKYESDQFDKKGEIEIGLKRNRFILKASQKVLKETKSKLKELWETVTKINKYLQLLSEKKDDSTVYHEYGNLLAEIGLHRLAVNEYQNSLQLKRIPNVHLALARSYVVLEKIEAARQELRKYREMGGKKEKVAKVHSEIEGLAKEWRKLAEDYQQQGNWINAMLYARKLERAGLYPEIASEIIASCLEKREQKTLNIERKEDLDLKKREREQEFKKLIDNGKELMNNKKFDEALECFKKAIGEAPYGQDTVEVRSLMACSYSEKNDLENAREIFNQLMEEYPETGIFNVNLGRGYIKNGLYGQAIKEYEAAIAKEKRFYFLYFEIGSVYMQAGEYGRAIESFEKYLKYSPDSYELIAKIGTCYLAKSMPPEAKAKYQEALKIQPDYEAATVGLGKIEEMEQRVRLKQSGLEEQPVGGCGAQGR